MSSRGKGGSLDVTLAPPGHLQDSRRHETMSPVSLLKDATWQHPCHRLARLNIIPTLQHQYRKLPSWNIRGQGWFCWNVSRRLYKIHMSMEIHTNRCMSAASSQAALFSFHKLHKNIGMLSQMQLTNAIWNSVMMGWYVQFPDIPKTLLRAPHIIPEVQATDNCASPTSF